TVTRTLSSGEMTVTPTVDLAPGPGLPQGLTAGESWTGTLGRGVVLNLLSVNGGDDLTGTRIESSSPVVAFSGHACANVPSLGVEACDQLQEQLLPIERWGTRYVAVPFAARGDMPDTWMVIGGADGVQVTATIPIEGLGADEQLQTGQRVVFESDEPFELRADGPVLLVQLAHGAQGEGSIPDPRCGDFFDSGLGDPSMALVPAVASWRRSVMFTTPPGIADDHILLTAPEGTAVALDGTPLTDWRPLGGTGLSWLRTPVSDGGHRLEGTRPFGLITYGFDCFISYATVGGLNPSATQVPRGNCDLCQADSDCGPGGRCTAPDDDGPTVCALACTTAAECGADYTCAMRDGAQVCISTTACQGTLEPFCQDPPSCSGDTPLLDPGACACVGCLSDEDCGPNAFCNAQQTCEENSNTGGCQSDSDCVMGDTVGRCDATLGCYTPGQCGDQDPFDSSCPEGLMCTGLFPLFQGCAGCTDDTDCRAGEFCIPDPFGGGVNTCFVFPN
ncbi:MAG: hypothetical protein AAFX99_27100, partial [Myxococcota bacterium]